MARLPIPGSDDNSWGDILNTFLLVEHNADGTLKASGSLAGKVSTSRAITAGTGLTGGGDLSADRALAVSYGTTAGTAAQGDDSRITGAQQRSTLTTKGDIYAATASSTTTRLGVGSNGQVLTADSTQATGLKWATPSGGGSAADPLAAAYGLIAQTLPPALIADRFALNAGVFVVCLVYLPAGNVSTLGLGIRTLAVTSTGANAMGLYSRDSATSATLVAQTGDMTSAFSSGSAPAWISGSISGGPVAVTAGQYYVAALTHFSSGAEVVTGPDISNSFGSPGLPRINGYFGSLYQTGQTTLPAAFNPSTYSINNVVYYMTVS
jgi:hypothetical protein